MGYCSFKSENLKYYNVISAISSVRKWETGFQVITLCPKSCQKVLAFRSMYMYIYLDLWKQG